MQLADHTAIKKEKNCKKIRYYGLLARMPSRNLESNNNGNFRYIEIQL